MAWYGGNVCIKTVAREVICGFVVQVKLCLTVDQIDNFY